MAQLSIAIALVVIIVILLLARKEGYLTAGVGADTVNGRRYATLHYAPWCGACKQMAPVWQEVKVRLANHPIVFGESNEDVSPTPGVRAYPTIYLLDERGRKTQYRGGPSLSALTDFLLAPVPIVS